jgi:NADH-quinone oxidoreductase subunit A
MRICAFEYIKIFIFLFSIIIIAGLLFLIPFIFTYRTFRRDRHTPVECGCDPRGSGKSRMEISYYVVSILFIIFEVEFIILIPWFLYFDFNAGVSVLPVVVFLFLLLVGLVYEYLRGVLDT